MRPATLVLHEQLIRLSKGAIKAWETWLESAKQEAARN